MIDTAIFFADKRKWYAANKTVSKSILITELPKNLKTPAKLKFLNQMPDEITEAQFVELLQYQTTGADYVNIDYLLDYYKIECDDNLMPIFANDFRYKNLKPQALYTYVIVKNLQTHPVFKNYPELIKFEFEQRLEQSLFTKTSNFKYDLGFNDRNILIEIDEAHHKRHKNPSKQNITDDQKDALVKIVGKTLFRINTLDVVDIDTIKKNIFLERIRPSKRYNEDFIESILEKIYTNKSIPEIEQLTKIPEIMRQLVILAIHKHLNISKTQELKKNYQLFTARFKNEHNIINFYIYNTVNKILDIIINEMIAATIKNSSYLRKSLDEMFVLFFHSMLTDFQFRQDYIYMIFKEDVLDELTHRVDSIKFLNSADNKVFKNPHIIDEQIKGFTLSDNTIKKIITSASNEFIALLKLKAKSIQNMDNPYVITVKEVASLLDIRSDDAIENLEACILNTVTCIHGDLGDVNDIMLSWEDINNVLKNYTDSNSFIDMLLIYYMKIDKIYEKITAKIALHNNRIISTELDYQIYAERIKNKIDSKYLANKNNKIEYENNKIYNDLDFNKIIKQNSVERYNELCNSFKNIMIEYRKSNPIITSNESDDENDDGNEDELD